MSVTLVVVIAILVLLGLFAWLWLRKPEPAEPREESDVLAPVRRGPRSSAGAVALEEPDEDDDNK